MIWLNWHKQAGLGRRPLILNALQISAIFPDLDGHTVVKMANGVEYLVQESIQDVCEKIARAK